MLKKITPIMALALLSACGNSSDKAATEKSTSRTAEKPTSEIANLYIRIRKLAAVGELETAASLTDNPDAYLSQMTTALERMGDVSFSENMEDAALSTNIHSEEKSGDFAMLIVKYTHKGASDMAATFFRKSDESYLEMIAQSDDVPCDLVKKFYETRGDAEYEIDDCTPVTQLNQEAA